MHPPAGNIVGALYHKL